MHIAIVNETGDPRITMDGLEKAAGCLMTQCVQHFCPSWELMPPTITVADTIEDAPADATPLVLLRSADQAGVLGYHTVTPTGRAYAKVFTDPAFNAGEDWCTTDGAVTTVISHELLEALGDPYCAWWADKDATTEAALEVADPVEGDSYVIDGVRVSNFVTPRWTRPGIGPYDYLGILSAPLTIAPGGYMIVREGGPSGKVTNVFGERYAEWKKDKSFIASRAKRRALTGC